MITVDRYIFGDGVLHERFFATTQILAKVVSSAPRPVRIIQLEEATGRGTACDRTAGNVEVFLMQTMLAVNQSVFHNLRQFSLDRLKISAAGMIPAPRSALRGYGLEDDSDLAIAGREAGMPEPQRISA